MALSCVLEMYLFVLYVYMHCKKESIVHQAKTGDLMKSKFRNADQFLPNSHYICRSSTERGLMNKVQLKSIFSAIQFARVFLPTDASHSIHCHSHRQAKLWSMPIYDVYATLALAPWNFCWPRRQEFGENSHTIMKCAQ